MVFDVPVRAQNQRLNDGARRQRLEALRGEAVQPGQPVRAGDADDAAMGPVHQAGRLRERALLAGRITVMGRDACVGSPGRDGAGQPEQRAFHGGKAIFRRRVIRRPSGGR